jgi:hypothetical protein
VDVTGNLALFSSAIASFNGGNISVNAGGKIAVGSESAVTALGARGIFTTAQGDVTVIAGGDIDVNGSRIATYDGGNVTVESLGGNINAGTGGAGFVSMTAFEIDPATKNVVIASPTVPGSGILATTFPDGIEWQEGDKFVKLTAQPIVGNILVETPKGSVLASAGGIIQSPLNSAKGNADAVTEVLAGYELVDSKGNLLTAANISSGTILKVADNCDIDASGSGIIGENVTGEATGTFKGVVFGQGNVNLTSPVFTSLTVLGGGGVSAQGSLGAGDTLIGAESVTTSGGAGGATILSANANGGGSSFSQGTVANAASAAASATDATAATTAAKSDTTGTEDDQSKKKKPISLARKVSRVTVFLPGQH